jgi:hypothetical protein
LTPCLLPGWLLRWRFAIRVRHRVKFPVPLTIGPTASRTVCNISVPTISGTEGSDDFNTQSLPFWGFESQRSEFGRATSAERPYDLRCPVGSRAYNAVFGRRRAMLRVTLPGSNNTDGVLFIPPMACWNRCRRNLQLTRGVSALPLGGCAWVRWPVVIGCRFFGKRGRLVCQRTN